MTERPVRTQRGLPPVVTILVVVSVVVNVLVAVAVGVLAVYSLSLGQQNTANTARIHASQIEACGQANAIRVQDIAIWNRLLDSTPAQKAAETPAARAEVAELEHLVKVKDTPVNCAVLYGGTGR